MAERTISEILEALARIETNVEAIAQNSVDHEQRLRTLEQRGAKRWDAISLAILSAVAVGITGFVLGKLF